jgi:hypothetical protein
MKQLISFVILLVLALSYLPAQSIPNGGFESWIDNPVFNVEEPEFWVTSNIAGAAAGLAPNVTKSSDAHGGSSAMRLETILDSSNEPYMGSAVLATGISGGKPLMVRGYYKLDLQGSDVPSIGIIMRQGLMIIGGGDFEFTTATDNYTYFEFEIEYFIDLMPDTILMSVFNDFEDVGTVGTVLHLDDLSFDTSTGVEERSVPSVGVQLSPNPVVDQLQVRLAPETIAAFFQIYDLSGRPLGRYYINGQATLMLNLPGGMYVYELRDRVGTVLAVDQFVIR